MPIRFRCSRCNRLLGIARRKAGTETRCPHCGSTITVPAPDGPEDDQTELEEIDELLNPGSAASAALPSTPAPAPGPAVATRPTPAAPPVPRPVPPLSKSSPVAPEPIPLPPEERPLFERDVDSVLGASNKAPDRPDDGNRKPATTSGMDAMSLGGERGQVVLSSQKATALAVLVVVLLALAFAAGFLIASR